MTAPQPPEGELVRPTSLAEDKVLEGSPPQLLFLCHRIPYPPDKGEKIRAFHILRHLAQSHAVHLGCLIDDPDERIYLEELRSCCASIGCYSITPIAQRLRAIAGFRPGRPLTADLFRNPGLARWVTETVARHEIDRVFVFSSAMTEYVKGIPSRIRVFDMVDVDSEKWRSYAKLRHWPMAAVYRREARTLQAWERRAVGDFDVTLFVSEAEAERFATLAPGCRDRIGWLDNGVDLETFSPGLMFDRPYAEGTINILFTGTMSYWPNVDAVLWFAKDVLAKLQRRCPRIQFWVVGAKPDRPVLQLRQLPGVKVTGWVPDVRPFLSHADVVVAPLRIARGTQNKVLEAMAMGRPVVATTEAFEGLRMTAGQDLLVCDKPDEMAERILEIVNGQYPGLKWAARLAVERNYCWGQKLRRLDELFPSAG